jgi:hypothetical protein
MDGLMCVSCVMFTFRCLNSKPCLLLCTKNMVCNNVELLDFNVM